MNQRVAAAVHAVMPPILWNAYLRLRGRTQRFPWRAFGNMGTSANAEPLLEGDFAEIYAKYQPLDPFVPLDVTRYSHYNNCFFAKLCRNIPGDFLCAGVSWGLAARIVYDFTDFAMLGKTLHLVDPFEGVVSKERMDVSARYNRDPDYVLRQYPAGAPVAIHRKRIPLDELPGQLAFVFCDTGDAAADAGSLPGFYNALSSGGMLITNQYANDLPRYRSALTRLGIAPLWLPSGQGVIFKR